jgi:ABC-2 type transport system permease protein
VVYLVDGFRWSFVDTADVGVGWSLGATILLLLACVAVVGWMVRTGYRLKN